MRTLFVVVAVLLAFGISSVAVAQGKLSTVEVTTITKPRPNIVATGTVSRVRPSIAPVARETEEDRGVRRAREVTDAFIQHPGWEVPPIVEEMGRIPNFYAKEPRH